MRIQLLDSTRKVRIQCLCTIYMMKESLEMIELVLVSRKNRTPIGEVRAKELGEWDTADESNALLGNQKVDSRMMTITFEDDHPFNINEQLNNVSLLSSTDRVLQAF